MTAPFSFANSPPPLSFLLPEFPNGFVLIPNINPNQGLHFHTSYGTMWGKVGEKPYI